MLYLKKSLPYFAAPILALTIFFAYFDLWNVDFAKPLFNNYQWDVLLNGYFAKAVIDNGWVLTNKYVGLPQFEGAFYLYDFPLQGNSLNFLMFKFFAIFSSNPFAILNYHYLLTIAMVALFTFIALRNFGISIFTSLLICLLYDFIFYHIERSIFHSFLSNYATVPLSIMVGHWIMNDKIKIFGLNSKKQYAFKPNWYCFWMALIAAAIASSEIYYAIYSCVFLAICWFIRFLRNAKFFDESIIPIGFYCMVVFIVFLCLYMPSLYYWMENGVNQSGAIRQAWEGEFYALRIIDLLAPITNHYFESFAGIREFFNAEVLNEKSSSQYERCCEALGILGSLGFIFLLLWNFSASIGGSKIFQRTIDKLNLQKNEVNLLSNLALFNLLIILFATVGGFVIATTPFFAMLRAHARFSIFIGFISFLAIAIIFDKIVEKKIFGKKIYAQIILFVVFVLALFDQMGNPNDIKFSNKELERSFYSDQNFVTKIEQKIPPQSNIYVLPIANFPEGSKYESLLYLHSKTSLWSYPVMRGRPSAKWQNKIEMQDFEQFIKSLKSHGFNAVLVNRNDLAKNLAGRILSDASIKTKFYNKCYMTKDWNGVYALENKLTKIAKLKLVSEDEKFSFYEI